jgi:NAD(P)-dependent dehydrogenase (short-subunit alcohol dehydrogenase family)
MKPCPERLRDKVTLVTGGARGIGRAICERFAAEGARVAVADLDATECAQVAGEIGEGTFGVRLDVTNQGSIDAAVGAVVEKFGRIDVLINNAVVWELQPLLEMTRERAARVFAVNVEGLIFTTQAVARQMITQGQGGASSTSLPRQDGAAKRFRSPMALDLVRHGINVNAIAPGIVDTPMWDVVDATFVKYEGMQPGERKRQAVAAVPAGRFGDVREIAAMAAFLASDDAAYIVAQCYNVDGGSVMS